MPCSNFDIYEPILIITPPPVRERSIAISMSICMCLCVFVRDHIFGTVRPIFTKFFVHVIYGRGAVFLCGVVIRYVFPVFPAFIPVARRHRPAKAQCTRSLGLGYKLCTVIPVAGQLTHGTTFRALKVTSQVATQAAKSAV